MSGMPQLDVQLVLAMAAATWLLRAGFVLLVPASRMPPSLRTALEHLPVSVLAALVAVDLAGAVRGSRGPGEALALPLVTGVLALVAWRTRSVTLVSALSLAAVVGLDVVAW